jgi:hypothetical protein
MFSVSAADAGFANAIPSAAKPIPSHRPIPLRILPILLLIGLHGMEEYYGMHIKAR